MNRYISVLFIVYQITDLFSNEGRTTNFGHPAIKELSKCFYYSGKPDCLSSLFPKNFKTFPKPSLAMVCTCVSVFLTATTICERFFFLQIVNCLEEWQTGAHIKIPFSGDRYESVYQDMSSLINSTEEHAYHGRKLRKLLASIANDGRYDFIIVFLHFF